MESVVVRSKYPGLLTQEMLGFYVGWEVEPIGILVEKTALPINWHRRSGSDLFRYDTGTMLRYIIPSPGPRRRG